MRDPLHQVSVRYKLAALFVSQCLIAYGIGGFLVSRSAGGALEQEILSRLEFQCHAYASALDSSLGFLTQRAQDFASDGYIRDRVSRIAASAAVGDVDGDEHLRDELARHLTRNKLPLVGAFRNLAVSVGVEEPLVAVDVGDVERLSALVSSARSVDGLWYSGLLGSVGVGRQAELVVATPIYDLDGVHDLGRLMVVIDVPEWLTGSLATASTGPHQGGEDVRLSLLDVRGRLLEATLSGAGALGNLRVADDAAASPVEDYAPLLGLYAKSFPIPTLGWSVQVTLAIDEALRPVSGLHSQFLGVGLLLAVVSILLMYFPMHFLARPLDVLTKAAEELREGALDTRVIVDTDDEIGALGRAFNSMAVSIQERTRWLERSADNLRQRQGELRSERDRLDTVITSMKDGLVVLDPGGKVLIANTAATPLLDLVASGDEAQGRHVCLDKVEDDLANLPEHHLRKSDCMGCLFEGGGPSRSCTVDLSGRTFEIHTTPLQPDAQGERGRVLVSREVTDRIQQDERQIHNERLSLLGEVAAVVAHELNNPLASISMFNQMLIDELPSDSPLHENSEVISRNVDAAKRTIRELLDFATGASPEVGAIHVHESLGEVLRFLRPLLERSGVAAQLETEARFDQVTGDAVQLRQVFANLVINAIQAMTGGMPRPGGARPALDDQKGLITLSTRDADGRLEIDISDTGPGIPIENQRRIFKPFFTTKARGEGTGLGLSTSRRIVEMQGGSLELQDSSSEGTTFRISLRTRITELVT